MGSVSIDDDDEVPGVALLLTFMMIDVQRLIEMSIPPPSGPARWVCMNVIFLLSRGTSLRLVVVFICECTSSIEFLVVVFFEIRSEITTSRVLWAGFGV